MTKFFLSLFIVFGFVGCKPTEPEPPVVTDKGVSLTMRFKPTFKDTLLGFSKTFITGSGDSIKFDRIKFLISNFILEKKTGELVSLSNQYAFLSLNDERDSVILSNVPKGDYKSFRFLVGLDSSINHGDPSQWPLTHALSPSLNDMHWGWAGGYIFNIIEGYYQDKGKNAGFSFHLATEKYMNLQSFIFDYSIAGNSGILFELKTDKYFDNVVSFSLKNDGAFSHSGVTDAVMDKFYQNVGGILEFKSFH